MTDTAAPALPKWPFLLGDLLFLALAGAILQFSTLPLTQWQVAALIVCVGAGAWLAVTPFLADHKAAVQLGEAGGLATTVGQIQNLEAVAAQIATATGQWQSIQDQSVKTITAANVIAERMASEAKSFADFMQKASDAEKAHLRLEVEKLRRAESDWLQIIVRMLDHVYALHQAGVRSGQPALIQQLGHFQAACRDVARRIGLVPFTATPDEPFKPETHQLADAPDDVPPGARVGETIITGFTYQGQLLRRAVVVLKTEATAPVSLPETSPGPTLETSLPAEQQLL